MEKETEAQAMHDQAKMFAPKLGYALALQVDDTLAGLPDNFTQTVGTLATGTTLQNIIRAVQYQFSKN